MRFACPLLLLFACLALAVSMSTAVPVAVFQESGAFSTGSYMRYTGQNFSVPIPQLTFCFRMQVFRLRGYQNTMVSYAVNRVDNALYAIILAAPSEPFRFEICKMWRSSDVLECLDFVAEDVEFHEWLHLCATFRKKEQPDNNRIISNITVYLNGEPRNESSVELNLSAEDFRDLSGDGVLILGQDQDSPGGRFDAGQALSGKISQFGLWDRVLTDDEIKSLANCEAAIEGNIYDWSSLQNWTATSEVRIEEVPLEQLCHADLTVEKFIISKPVRYVDFKSMCDKIGGALPVLGDHAQLVSAHAEVQRAFADLPERPEKCILQERGQHVTFWSGQVFSPQTGTWMDPYEHKALPSKATDPASVNPLASSSNPQCAYTWGDFLVQRNCDTKSSCGVCFLGQRTRLMLKGLCAPVVDVEQDFDTFFFIKGQMNGQPHFHGVMNSHLYYDDRPDFMTWHLESLRSPGRSLVWEDPVDGEMPYGRHVWSARGARDICGRRQGDKITLTLSTCYPEQFTCDDGTCIALGERCDGKINCADKSDERLCDFMTLGTNYAKEIQPSDAVGGLPLKVYLNVTVMAFSSIDTVNMKFTADVLLRMRWYESRIVVKDLNTNPTINRLNEKDFSSLWTPQLSFANALGPFQTRVDDIASAVFIRETGHLKEDFSTSVEAMLFSGANNSLQLTREYYHEYGCQFHLEDYPFDTQVCAIILQVERKTDDFVTLVRDGAGVEFLGDRELIEYDIQLMEFSSQSEHNVSRAAITFVFRRRMEYHVFSTILQTGILVLTGYITFYFSIDDFTNRIMVTLTSTLVLATVVSSVRDGLPRTSYYKLIDWWMLFCMLTLVITMVFHTYINVLVKRVASAATRTNSALDTTHTSARKVAFEDTTTVPDAAAVSFNRVAKVITTLAACLFQIAFWAVSFVAYFAGPEKYLR